MRKYNRPSLSDIRVQDPVFAARVRTCIERTVPANMEKIVETGRLDAFRLNWQEGNEKKPHIYCLF